MMNRSLRFFGFDEGLTGSQKIEEIIGFWFNGISSPDQVHGVLTPYWFCATPSLNQEINSRFSQDIENALSNSYDTWLTTPKGSLALIILLDQFTRNLYPRSIEKVKGDPKAREISRHIISKGFESDLWPIHLLFAYLPFEHSENLQDQVLSVEKFKELVNKVPDQLKIEFNLHLMYAEIHKKVIQRFGRFPGRNYFMGRESTEEEKLYLIQDPYKF